MCNFGQIGARRISVKSPAEPQSEVKYQLCKKC